jgi:hypothetical protein
MAHNQHLLIALTEPTADQDDAFNDWYENTHVPECLRVPGFKSGQRYKLTASLHNAPQQAYLALYELEGDKPQDVLDALAASRDDRTPSAAIDRSKTSLWVFSPIGEKQYGLVDDD